MTDLDRVEQAGRTLVDKLLECPVSASPMAGMWPRKRKGRRDRGAGRSPTFAELSRLDQTMPAGPRVKEDLDVWLMSEQPPTCPKCGRRVDILKDVTDPKTRETVYQICQCPECGFKYRLEPDEDDPEEPEESQVHEAEGAGGGDDEPSAERTFGVEIIPAGGTGDVYSLDVVADPKHHGALIAKIEDAIDAALHGDERVESMQWMH
jgi:DNA-directed RNA polymerase subunit RPC12/RpoP